ncbi:ER lumen retaining receptor protein, putative [Trypanosoma cruzi]|uniref:ER lumen protein-retaining receptor n=1 Tax=Trypanosoma cruzi TaxID=5693 RepID=A0A2V2VWZ6_TRYCR|nr:ER lumen retaining receptor protein, putative [Trypanosoma cruzi]KAF8283011.1 putative ER lumen retaining receptor protein [Trypanosoma cruzi]PBJ72157.1 ER lumen retaining receptor protein [Trypanosoma cruzi cruzi]PWV00615.1 putative ER lumen retaining receptor protein [Trypanosoma cruzi]RNF18310.1 putative ER lumen retaining receptor protein [Trypanosoma cruzi]
MNYLRTFGDMLHLLAIIILLGKMLRQRSAAGLSLKTQFLFALVFTTRYLDLFTSFLSLYNTLMKIFFLTTSWHICYLMRNKSPWKATYDHENDTFRIRYLIVPCIVLALLFHGRPRGGWLMDFLWAFSQYLEAVAILPQIFLLEYTERYEALTSHYLAAMGAYRFFYLLHWIHRYLVLDRVNVVSVSAGLLQTVLYVDFFYHYLTQVVRRAKQRYDLAR